MSDTNGHTRMRTTESDMAAMVRRMDSVDGTLLALARDIGRVERELRGDLAEIRKRLDRPAGPKKYPRFFRAGNRNDGPIAYWRVDGPNHGQVTYVSWSGEVYKSGFTESELEEGQDCDPECTEAEALALVSKPKAEDDPYPHYYTNDAVCSKVAFVRQDGPVGWMVNVFPDGRESESGYHASDAGKKQLVRVTPEVAKSRLIAPPPATEVREAVATLNAEAGRVTLTAQQVDEFVGAATRRIHAQSVCSPGKYEWIGTERIQATIRDALREIGGRS